MKKSAKSVPASKPAAKSAPKPAVAKPAAKAVPAKKAAAPAKKKLNVAAEPPATFISAQIDIGFGNHLYLRGEGPGLSWHRGIAMDSVGASLWTAAVKGATLPVVFKVLVNDLSWSAGADYTVEPGQSVTVTPTF
ncbi:MAG TPA: hypothetical protein VHN79_00825 [Lacunisphaera sp.]|nr:hypothetical protein [Lacunisphaera sp.]